MREVIVVSIGQAGCQIGKSVWDLLTTEHGISPEGDLMEKCEDSSVYCFFYNTESDSTKFMPRSVFIDLEPSVVDTIRNGEYKNLYDKRSIINEVEDASNIFSSGRFTKGKSIQTKVSNTIRKHIEKCDAVSSMIFTHGIAGGTGSGYTCNLLNGLAMDQVDVSKFSTTIVPSPFLEHTIVAPYNACFFTQDASQYLDLHIMLDNEAIYNLISDNVMLNRPPTYAHLNQLIACMISNITACVRFNGSLNLDLNDLLTNLVPFRALSYTMPSCQPLVALGEAERERLSVIDITAEAFYPGSDLISCDSKDGTYFSCALMYRGDVVPKEANSAIRQVKKAAKFASWSPTGFKVSINSQPLRLPEDTIFEEVPRNLTKLMNHSSITQTFTRLETKFDMLYERRAFVHWYVLCGQEEGEFGECREFMAVLKTHYRGALGVLDEE